MNVVIVGGDDALERVLAARFALNGRQVRHVAPAQIDALYSLEPVDEGERSLLIDVASRATILGAKARFSQAEYERAVARCAERAWPYLLLSDCRVFGGGHQRHRESDSTAPDSAEGRAFASREAVLAVSHPQHVVVRSGPLLTADDPNPLTRLVALLHAGGVVPASTEQRFSPVAPDDIARVIAAIVDQLDCGAQCWGIYHYCSADTASPYEFAEAILAAANQYWALPDSVAVAAAPASLWSGDFPLLNCQHIRDTFGIQQFAWRKAIPDLLKQMQKGKSS